MSTGRIKTYLGHDNTEDIILKTDGAAQDLTSITRMTMTFGTKLVDSDNGSDDPIQWCKTGYASGEVRFSLGGQTITPALYNSVPLIVYDAVNTDGIVWGTLVIEVIAEVEGV